MPARMDNELSAPLIQNIYGPGDVCVGGGGLGITLMAKPSCDPWSFGCRG